jgi:hypothetical protein
MAHFLVHHQVHQLQSRLPQQVSHPLLQQAHDVGHRQDHLDVGVLFGREPVELLHRSLLFDLISFLHSDSLLFLGRKINRRPIMAASLRVATFYELPGNLESARTPRYLGSQTNFTSNFFCLPVNCGWQTCSRSGQ